MKNNYRDTTTILRFMYGSFAVAAVGMTVLYLKYEYDIKKMRNIKSYKK